MEKVDFRNLPKAAKLEPSALEVEEGKTYAWCTCGLSKKDNGLCDGSHKACWTEDENGEPIKHFKSQPFTCEKTELVWLCNCKQTKTPPYCDGTHKMLRQESAD